MLSLAFFASKSFVDFINTAQAAACKRLQHYTIHYKCRFCNICMPTKMLFSNKCSCNFSIILPLLLLLLLNCCFVQHADALVVPQELPSILSLVYSNIPQIKKGTDSRLGFGFRLGEHADFQVLLELGPQKETRPIGDQDMDNSFNKRQVSKTDQRALWRQQFKELQEQQAARTSTERTAASWLETWSQDMNANKKKTKPTNKQALMTKKQHEKGLPLPTAATLMPEQALQQLQRLYQMATTTTTTSTSTELPTTSQTAAADVEFTQAGVNLPKMPYGIGPLNLGGPAGFTPRNLAAEDLQLLQQLKRQKSKKEITKELMDVSLEAGE